MLQQTVEETPAPCIPLELDRIPGLSSSADPDVPLVEALKARTAAAFDELVKQFENRLLNVAMKITKNREDAEDVVQEAFLKVFKNIDGFRADSKFSTWLIRIVINQALMLIRGNPQKLVSIDERTEGEERFANRKIATGSDTPEQLYAQREFEDMVLNLAHVRESSQRVMDLSINQNLSDIEISQILSLTLSAVKARLYRGRLDLREAMGRHFRPTKFDQTREDVPATIGQERIHQLISCRKPIGLSTSGSRNSSMASSVPAGWQAIACYQQVAGNPLSRCKVRCLNTLTRNHLCGEQPLLLVGLKIAFDYAEERMSLNNERVSMSKLWRVIIVGGGFGGLHAAQALKSDLVDVTLIDRRNYHLFQPLLYQVATGSLSPGEVAAPLRSVLSRQKNTRVLLGTVEDVDPDSKQVFLADGAVLPYDSLIVAAGSQTSYFGHDEWRDWAAGMKSIEEATIVRHKILYAFEVAERISDPEQRRAWLTFVIVGAGPTGVELAGAIAEIARKTLKNDFRSIHPDEAQIILLDGAPRVLMPFPEDLAQKAHRSLTKLGVHIQSGALVKAVDKDGLAIEVNKRLDYISAKTVMWAGGITASPLGKILAGRTKAETDKGGRIKVKPDLTIPNYPDIYVVGDLASAVDAQGKPLPGLAQVAMQGGSYAAKAILGKVTGRPALPPFKYFDKGSMAVIGHWSAVANAFGLHVSGFLAWMMWAAIHLTYIVTFQSRVLVFFQWIMQDLTRSRGARLITGVAPTDFNFNKEVAVHSSAPEVKAEPVGVAH